MQFREQDKPYLAGNQILRNDKVYIVAYESTVEKNKYLVLPFNIALILPLFDGTNNLSDIKKNALEIFSSLFGKVRKEGQEISSEKLSEIVDQTVESILSLNMLTLEGERSPSLENLVKLIPDIEGYQSSIVRLSRPLSVSISFTNRCQYDCIYCYAERKKCEEKELNQWIKIFDELQENEIFLVDIGGTDIFARPDALEILQAMVDRNFVFLLSTKSFIDEDTAKCLASMHIGTRDSPEHLFRYVQLSIDSVDASTAGYMVKKKDHYEKTIQSVKNLVKVGICPKIKCVLTPLNYLEMPDIIDEFSGIGVRDFQFVQYSRSKYRHNDDLFLSFEQKEFISNFAESINQNYPLLNISVEKNLTTGGKRNLSPEKWKDRAVCSGGRSNLIIQPNGDVTLCEQIPHREEFIVGNVFDEGVMSVWNSKRLIDFIYPPRKKFKNSVCYECLEFDACHRIKGYCYRDSFSSYGTIYDAQPECPFQTKMPVREI
ncbi:radical SAM/SPASM domain-containing protein [Methanosarcina thermophila MST-A1]|jgi:radical SAM protein with 4Fe4S-binding SPASM domain|nr:radical SAM protein [Methanosarcina thermophila]GLI14362.1 radical SAM/SPASM domain-containing protein [Methanosarcina thermophila MST-A1]